MKIPFWLVPAQILRALPLISAIPSSPIIPIRLHYGQNVNVTAAVVLMPQVRQCAKNGHWGEETHGAGFQQQTWNWFRPVLSFPLAHAGIQIHALCNNGVFPKTVAPLSGYAIRAAVTHIAIMAGLNRLTKVRIRAVSQKTACINGVIVFVVFVTSWSLLYREIRAMLPGVGASVCV